MPVRKPADDPRTSESRPDPSYEQDPVMAAIDGLLAVARANIVSWAGVMERAESIREQRRQGLPYSEMTVELPGPSIIDAVARNQERLTDAAAVFRRALASALVEEGWSHGQIAQAFGVSRQRVDSLLKGASGSSVSVEAEPVT